MVKYLISYSSSIITLLNASTTFWIIRLTTISGSNGQQLAELIFLIGLFPVITLGYPMAIVAEVSRSRRLNRIIINSAYFYMFISWLIICLISFIFFIEVWWVSSAYPLVFVLSLIRGYFEALEKFWLSAIFKLLISSALLGSASYLVLREYPPQIFVILCIGMSTLIIFIFYKKSEHAEQTNLNLFRYSIQAVVMLSFIFLDRFIMKFFADVDSYVSFIIIQEALYKIVSLFMLLSVFHFPEMNSKNISIRQKGLTASKWQLLVAFFSIIIFVLTPLNKIFFDILGINAININFFMFPALFLPIMSLLLQKYALSQLSDGMITIFAFTLVGSFVIGSFVTYILEDPFVSMASRGAVEVLILIYFILKKQGLRSLNG